MYVSVYNTIALAWTLATQQTTWESVLLQPSPQAIIPITSGTWSKCLQYNTFNMQFTVRAIEHRPGAELYPLV